MLFRLCACVLYAQFLSCFMPFFWLSRTSRLNPHLIIIYAVCCILLLKSNLGSVTEYSFKWICGWIAMTDVLDISPVFETGQVFIHVCRGLTLHTLARRVCSSVWTVNCHPQLLAPRFLLPSQRSLTQKHTDLSFYRRRGLFCQFNRLNKSAYVIWNACVRGAFKLVFNWYERWDTRKLSLLTDDPKLRILGLVLSVN